MLPRLGESRRGDQERELSKFVVVEANSKGEQQAEVKIGLFWE